MKELLGDSVAELLAVLLTAVGSGALAIGGAVIEYAAFGNLLTGHATIGAWELVLGGLLLYAGVYLLGYQRLGRSLATSSE
ncbi:hypothetical protein L593_10050 [Salinarchaeum sp. Harcht-Bsk1]|uniref:hypothetical protein n=1 Tax=Salinarchaeum sp. Harcht-Bsk1 TaxID=1333523 RepID=UPI00034238E9|nr:hypothetical protein [Salinarchaeum sp. Harcht-Bsk1]AGN01955.1 hypothetical protein L593_10050 [Salinarchaeum sp. Harcht-Bsk1]